MINNTIQIIGYDFKIGRTRIWESELNQKITIY